MVAFLVLTKKLPKKLKRVNRTTISDNIRTINITEQWCLPETGAKGLRMLFSKDRWDESIII